MALVRKYPADRLTVERAADPWFKRQSARSKFRILTRAPCYMLRTEALYRLVTGHACAS